MTMEKILELKNINAGYADLQVLYDVSLHVNKGEIVALLGQNGAGKSTIMKVVMGMIPHSTSQPLPSPSLRSVPPSHGKDLNTNVFNAHLGGAGQRRYDDGLRGLSVSYVPQGKRVFANLTVTENVLVASEKDEIPEHLYNLFPILKSKGSIMAGHLSGGEQQMVALARALMDNPSLLLLDEPTLGLSPKYVSEIFEVIDRLRQDSDLSVLVIEHNLSSLLHIADRGYVLARGKVVKELTHQDFSSHDEVYRAIV